MIEKAIEKIKSEMEKKKDNPYIQAIGDFLLKQIEINKDAAKGIVSGNKTIEKSLKAVEKVARKKAVNGCAVMADREVFNIVKEYYGFEAVQDKFTQLETEEICEEIAPNTKEEKSESKVINVDFSTNLEDYL